MKNVAQDLWESEVDLATLACDAAIELDNLIIGKSSNLEAVNQLIGEIKNVEEITESEAQRGFPLANLSPATAVDLNNAIAASELSDFKANVFDLIEETKRIIESLRNVVREPQEAIRKNRGGVEKLKYFCLAFSKFALARKLSLYEAEPWHPYRR